MQPTWSNGKVHCYKSNLDIEPSTNVNKENEPTEPTEQPQPQPSTSRLETHRDSPIKRHPVVRVEPLVAKKKNLKQECRMCGVSEETSFFLGCGHTNQKTRRQDCQYWVHQHCIGLYYKKKSELQSVPYYCKKHGPTQKKRNQNYTLLIFKLLLLIDINFKLKLLLNFTLLFTEVYLLMFGIKSN